MKYLIKIIFTFLTCLSYSQENISQVDLSDFKMSNDASPAFLLIGDSPTSIYAPTNLKALSIHVLNNFAESISIELTPYFFINTQSKNRTFYKYIGIEKNEKTNEIKQYPFRGLNTTNISFAYVDKQFEGIVGERKTYSVGVRSTIVRFYRKNEVYENINRVSEALSSVDSPTDWIIARNRAQTSGDNVTASKYTDSITNYYRNERIKLQPIINDFQKTIKPLFRVDGAIAYSTLFKENNTDSGTAKRFGAWLTAEGSLLLNDGSNSNHNNYFNAFFTARYIEDGFNIAVGNNYFNNYYRDFGGKIEFEIGRVAIGYEYISRNGSINSERSIGNIKYTINKDISITGGFGKDFPLDDNLVTVFGINWGLNIGGETVSILE